MRLERYFKPEPTVSTEGFSDIVKGIRGLFKQGKPKPSKLGDGKKRAYYLQEMQAYSRDFGKQMNALKQALQKTYANKKWMDSQELVDGDIKADDITPFFVLGKKVQTDFIGALNKNKQRLAVLYGPTREKCVAYGKALSVIDDALCKEVNGWEVNDKNAAKVDALLAEAIVKIKKLADIPVTAYKQAVGDYLPYNTITVNADGITITENKASLDKIPALSKEGVLAHANALIDLIDLILDLDGRSWYMKGSTEDDGETLRDFYDWSSKMDEYYDLTYYQTLDSKWDSWDILGDMVGIVLALEKLLDRSVK
jgi:hypothetical protein